METQMQPKAGTTWATTLLNPRSCGTGSFPQFPRLPIELQSMIWTQYLCHERILTIDLYPSTDPYVLRSNKPCRRLNFLFRQTDGFIIVSRDRHVLSKLFRVCCSSRAAASRFYRVEIPCYYKDHAAPEDQQRMIPATLRLHPDLDILHINGTSDELDTTRWTSGLKSFAKVADMIWRRDPQRVGLVHIALTRSWPSQSWDGMCHPDETDLLRETLARLRTVILGCEGWLKEKRIRDPEEPNETSHCYCQPSMTSIPTFHRLQTDPRQINYRLADFRVNKGKPKHAIYEWFAMLKKRNIEFKHPVKYRFMFHHGFISRASTRDVAWRMCQDKEMVWRERRKATTSELQWVTRRAAREAAGKPMPHEEVAGLKLPRAFGFWLFPLEAFGPVLTESQFMKWGPPPQPNRTLSGFRHWRSSMNLSHSNPELCLQYLAESPSQQSQESDSLDGIVSDSCRRLRPTRETCAACESLQRLYAF